MAGSAFPYIKNVRSSGEKKFSILIPSWNNLPYLQLCIDSILRNSSYSHQIIVHVNEGNDGTLQWIESQTHVDYTYSDQNVGICYALNYARTIASTDYIVYVNDDMYMCPGWDKILMNEINATGHPFFFFSSTMIEPYRVSTTSVIKDYGRDLQTFEEDRLLAEYSSIEYNDWNGATWPPNIVHKDVWDLVGGYSIEFSPGFYSDPDFSMKLWRAGVRTFKGLGKSKVYHFGRKSTGRVRGNKGYHQFIGKWGITSSRFTDKVLRRGTNADTNGQLSDIPLNGTEKIKMLLKRVVSAFKKLP